MSSMLRTLSRAWLVRPCAQFSPTTRTMSTGSALHKRLVELPTYRAAQFQSSHVVRATASTVDLERKTKHSYARTFFISEDAVDSVLAPDASEIVASQLSPTGKLLAVLRESADPASPGQKKRSVEVWSGERIVAAEDVTSRHEAFYTDEYLSSLSFSPSETKLVYTAEGKAPEFSESEALSKYRFTPELGESYGGKKRPAIFLFDWSTKANGSSGVVQLAFGDRFEPPVIFGNPVFVSEDKLFAVGFEQEKDGSLLGIIYCPNRRAGIWELTLQPSEVSDNVLHCTSTKLTATDRSCRSPRVFQRPSKSPAVVYLSNPVGGPHARCVSLNIRDVTSGNERVLVDTVWDPKASEFPGLYITTIPAYPFLDVSGESYVVLTSTWRSRSTVLLVRLRDGVRTELTPDDDKIHYSWTVLSADGKDQIICTRSAPSRPPELVLGKLAANGQVQWRVVAHPELGEDLEQRLAKLSTTVLPVPDRFPVETIVVRGENDASAPCITQVHGGPHGSSLTAFSAFAATFALEGYTISMPNYTGSVGFGEKYIEKLMGHIGSLDVEDCIASVRHLVASGLARDGPGQQYLYGGSHGGFLLGHLVGQHPTAFSGAVLRNPVISLGEISTSDIPDWYYEECGVPYDAVHTRMTPQMYEKLHAMSAIAHVDAVRTPLAIMVGEKDQRVAPTQGKGFYHALKGRGREVELYCFKNDIHALDSAEGQWAVFEVAKRLFGLENK